MNDGQASSTSGSFNHQSVIRGTGRIKVNQGNLHDKVTPEELAGSRYTKGTGRIDVYQGNWQNQGASGELEGLRYIRVTGRGTGRISTSE